MKPCFECGSESEHDHHVVPESRGGTMTVPLCGECHAKAHHRNGAMSTNRLTAEALQRKIRNGERCGKVRYGYDLAADGKMLVENDREQGVIQMMVKMYWSGCSATTIAHELTRMGIPSKTGNSKWLHTSVAGILKRVCKI